MHKQEDFCVSRLWSWAYVQRRVRPIVLFKICQDPAGAWRHMGDSSLDDGDKKPTYHLNDAGLP